MLEGIQTRIRTGALGSWLRKPLPEKLFVAKTAFVLVALRLALQVISYQRVVSFSKGVAARLRTKEPPDMDLLKRRARIIEMAAERLFPKSPCLLQSLALCFYCWRRGIPSVVQFGAMKDEADRLAAHAWVELNGEVVIGMNDQFPNYAQLERLEQQK